MNIPFHKPYITDDEIEAVSRLLKTGWLTMGSSTADFEREFSHSIGAKHSIAVNSATSAMHLALVVLGIKEGDEVIIPAMTFPSTAEVVKFVGATPIFVDVEKDTHLIDISKLKEKITDRTKAIIPVHYGGQPCDMDEIMELAKKHNFYVVEDAAHSLPSLYKNRKVGTIGDFTCFSFYVTKTLCTGEGGMITTANDQWAERLKHLRLHGISKDAWKRYSSEGSWMYDVEEPGYKYNTTDINSVIGLEQLKKLDIMNNMRASIAAKYNSAFSQYRCFETYRVKEDRTTCWHLYPLKLNLETLKISRDQFVDELTRRNIGVSVHFIPLYRYTYYKKMGYNHEDFQGCESIFNRVFSIPIYPSMTEDEINHVIENIVDIAEKNRL